MEERERIPGKGIAMLVTFVCAGGFSGIFSKLALSEGLEASGAAFLRMSAAAVIMTLVVLLVPAKRRAVSLLSRRVLLLSLCAGAILGMHFWTWFLALQRLPAFTAMLLFDIQPVYVVALSWVFLKERVSGRALIGIGICLCAAVIISVLGSDRSGEATVLGVILCLTSSLLHAVYVLIGRAVMRERVDTVVYTWLLYAVCAAVLGIVVLIGGVRLNGFGSTTYIFIGHLVLVNTFLGHSLMNAVMRYVPAHVVSVSALAELVITAVCSFLVLNEVPNVWVWVGSAVLVCGLLIYNGAGNRENA